MCWVQREQQKHCYYSCTYPGAWRDISTVNFAGLCSSVSALCSDVSNKSSQLRLVLLWQHELPTLAESASLQKNRSEATDVLLHLNHLKLLLLKTDSDPSVVIFKVSEKKIMNKKWLLWRNWGLFIFYVSDVRNGPRCLGLEGDGLSTGISNKAQLLTQPVSEKHVKHKNNST